MFLGYVGYGLVAGGLLSDYKTGYRFGKMAIELCDEFDNIAVKCKANFLFAAPGSIRRDSIGRNSTDFVRLLNVFWLVSPKKIPNPLLDLAHIDQSAFLRFNPY